MSQTVGSVSSALQAEQQYSRPSRRSLVILPRHAPLWRGLAQHPALYGLDVKQTLVPELHSVRQHTSADRLAPVPVLYEGMQRTPAKARRLWAEDLNWRSGVLFFIGSILFSFSSIAGLFLCITNHGWRNKWMITYSYAFASTLYTWGAFCSMRLSWSTVSKVAAQQRKAAAGGDGRAARTPPRPGTAGRGAALLRSSSSAKQLAAAEASGSLASAWGRLAQPDMAWALLDLAAMAGIWIGTLLYNSSCITPAVLCTLRAPLPPAAEAAALRWLVALPSNVAGCLFVFGCFACWAAAERTLSLWHLLRLPRTLSYWSPLAYFGGSCGFLLGSSFVGQAVFVFAPAMLVEDWFGMFSGYVLGSLCFLIGSCITVVQGLE